MSHIDVSNCPRLNVLAFLSKSRAPEICKGNLSRVKDATSPRGVEADRPSPPQAGRAGCFLPVLSAALRVQKPSLWFAPRWARINLKQILHSYLKVGRNAFWSPYWFLLSSWRHAWLLPWWSATAWWSNRSSDAVGAYSFSVAIAWW